MLLESIEFTEEVTEAIAEPTEPLSFSQPILSLADYPPSDTPYLMEQGDFWLVHTPEGQLMAFSPLSPEYAGRVAVEECEFAWVEANQRFADPCSGDEWELNGRLNLEHSNELWSNRDLDQ